MPAGAIAAIAMTEASAVNVAAPVIEGSATIKATEAFAAIAVTPLTEASAMNVAAPVTEGSATIKATGDIAAIAVTPLTVAFAVNVAAPLTEGSVASAATVITVASVVIVATPGIRRRQEALHAHRATEDTHPSAQHRRARGRIANRIGNPSDAQATRRNALRNARGNTGMSGAPMLRVHARMNAIIRPAHPAVPSGETEERTRVRHVAAQAVLTTHPRATRMTGASR